LTSNRVSRRRVDSIVCAVQHVRWLLSGNPAPGKTARSNSLRLPRNVRDGNTFDALRDAALRDRERPQLSLN
jgi:hypothetical protein